MVPNGILWTYILEINYTLLKVKLLSKSDNPLYQVDIYCALHLLTLSCCPDPERCRPPAHSQKTHGPLTCTAYRPQVPWPWFPPLAAKGRVPSFAVSSARPIPSVHERDTESGWLLGHPHQYRSLPPFSSSSSSLWWEVHHPGKKRRKSVPINF